MPGTAESKLLDKLREAADNSQEDADDARKVLRSARERRDTGSDAAREDAEAKVKEAEGKLDKAEAKLALADAKLDFVGQLNSRVCVRAILTRTMLTVCVCSGVCPPVVRWDGACGMSVCGVSERFVDGHGCT